jgi:hypothetical protein
MAPAVGVSFNPAGNQLASAGNDGTLRLWDASPLTPRLREFQGARSVVEFLFTRSLRWADVAARIRCDPALSTAVRQRALALPESYHENRLLLHAD